MIVGIPCVMVFIECILITYSYRRFVKLRTEKNWWFWYAARSCIEISLWKSFVNVLFLRFGGQISFELSCRVDRLITKSDRYILTLIFVLKRANLNINGLSRSSFKTSRTYYGYLLVFLFISRVNFNTIYIFLYTRHHDSKLQTQVHETFLLNAVHCVIAIVRF